MSDGSSDDLFTASEAADRAVSTDRIFSIVAASLKGKGEDSTCPAPGSDAVQRLVMEVADLQHLDRLWTAQLADQVSEVAQIEEAMQTLHRLLTAHRPYYEEEALSYRREAEDRPDTFAAHAAERQEDLRVVDRLLKSLAEATDRGLPRGSVAVKLPNYRGAHSPRFRWRGFVRPLNEAFHAALPKRTKEDGYRFVQGSLFLVTGDQPSLDNIKDALKAAA